MLLIIGLVIGVVTTFQSCDNPFAPRLVEKPILDAGLGDQTTIDGVFQNFRYAYLTKDTLVYGRLLAQNFTFIYRNYDKGIDYTWSRDQDMQSTAGLFQTAQQLNLVWNDVVISTGDSLLVDISRGFNLSITFDPTDIIQVQGRVNLRLTRATTKDKWLILIWRDESNF
ncbi:MAG: hypothetical protein JNJ85_00985 [Candidatus Kapabacteria bacterium]|nr:hypothetical protein [Candidatus Kapabacteria bacterium]